jgi:myxalamid-type polyketide synthase MxaE and MxaD
MACRFPEADGPERFWSLLRDGVDAITEVPPERWDADAFYASTPGTPGKMVTRWGGFLKNVDQFDAEFFRISPREATRMDPQQRLLLELAWEGLEDAGQVPKELAGTDTGVFIGLSSSDYGRVQADPSESDAYMPTGNAASIAANRLSFFFDFQGPSFIVDTACSSALVALHLACRSIWNGESSLALAGGVNIILSPTNTINFSQAGALVPATPFTSERCGGARGPRRSVHGAGDSRRSRRGNALQPASGRLSGRAARPAAAAALWITPG